jgi:hypothetical protein
MDSLAYEIRRTQILKLYLDGKLDSSIHLSDIYAFNKRMYPYFSEDRIHKNNLVGCYDMDRDFVEKTVNYFIENAKMNFNIKAWGMHAIEGEFEETYLNVKDVIRYCFLEGGFAIECFNNILSVPELVHITNDILESFDPKEIELL